MPASKSGVWRNPKHGTRTGYQNYRCRCRLCTDWNTANQREARRKNPQYFSRYAKKWYAAHPLAARRDKVLRKYGLTLEAYEKMLQKQNGLCAVCCMPAAPNTHLHVDHDHRCCRGQRSCGECVRGLLCRRCNSFLGFVNDDKGLLEKIIAYLRATQE